MIGNRSDDMGSVTLRQRLLDNLVPRHEHETRDCGEGYVVGTPNALTCCLETQRETGQMAKTPQPGDAVSWKSHGGEAHGKVVKKITQPTQIKGHKVAASKDNPEFIVETDDGKHAAHKAAALSKA